MTPKQRSQQGTGAPRPDNLRLRLRRETSALSQDLDRVQRIPDLSGVAGLSQFLMVQRIMMGILARHRVGTLSREIIPDLAQRAKGDLITLGARVPLHANTLNDELADVHGSAVDYVVLGARVRMDILERKWRASTVPEVRLARAFMSAPEDFTLWRTCVLHLQRHRATGPEADRIVSDAHKIFAAFGVVVHGIVLHEAATPR
ncbi:hypothetical protein [Dinoroseobacter sp. S375]|uniref:hypothetical protein n=1 Tax=Dinoroseobacter sp. S375 TaxID=3415136 RepID=UPI003C7E1A73